MGKRTWSQEEINILQEHYPTASNSLIRDLLPNKTLNSIYCKANELKIYRNPESITASRPKHNFSQKGGVMYKRGYRYVLTDGHPNADRDGYVAEHRLIVEKELGRILDRSEHVHHINGVITDNQIKNLRVLSLAEHTALHHIGAKRSPDTCKNISIAKKEGFKKRREITEVI